MSMIVVYKFKEKKIMKKFTKAFLVIVMALLLTFSFMACGTDTDDTTGETGGTGETGSTEQETPQVDDEVLSLVGNTYMSEAIEGDTMGITYTITFVVEFITGNSGTTTTIMELCMKVARKNINKHLLIQ